MSNQKYEPVFSPDTDWQNNACINWCHSPIQLYAEGYKQAANNLVDLVITESRQIDTLVYPIVFLYRQYIELKLKETMLEGSALIDENKDFPKIHKIDQLWHNVRPLILKIWEEEDKEPVDFIEHVILDFSKIDPYSFAFRYPTEKDGTPNLTGIKHINVRRLADYMDKVSELLDGISAGISVYLDYKNEMKKYYL